MKNIIEGIGDRDAAFLTGFSRGRGFISYPQYFIFKINIVPFEPLCLTFSDTGVNHTSKDGLILGIGYGKDFANFGFLEADGCVEYFLLLFVAGDGRCFDECAANGEIEDGFKHGEFVIDCYRFDAVGKADVDIIIQKLFVKIIGAERVWEFILKEAFEVDDAVRVCRLGSRGKGGINGFAVKIEQSAHGNGVDVSFGMLSEVEPDFMRQRVEDIITQWEVVFDFGEGEFDECADFFCGCEVAGAGGTLVLLALEHVGDEIFASKMLKKSCHSITFLLPMELLSSVNSTYEMVCQWTVQNPSFGKSLSFAFQSIYGIIVESRRKTSGYLRIITVACYIIVYDLFMTFTICVFFDEKNNGGWYGVFC